MSAPVNIETLLAQADWLRRLARGLVRDENVAEIAARVEVQRRVAEAVLALDEPYRTVVLLRFFEYEQPGDRAAARPARIHGSHSIGPGSRPAARGPGRSLRGGS